MKLTVKASGSVSQVRRQVDEQMASADHAMEWPDADALYNLIGALIGQSDLEDHVTVSARLEGNRDTGRVHLSLVFTASEQKTGAADAGPGGSNGSNPTQGDTMATGGNGRGKGSRSSATKTAPSKGSGATKTGGSTTSGTKTGGTGTTRTGGQGDNVSTGTPGGTSGSTGHNQGEGSKAGQ